MPANFQLIVSLATIIVSFWFTVCKAQCATGWTNFQNNCYKFNQGNIWDYQCDTKCAEMESSVILCVENAEQNSFIAGYVGTGSATIWLGLLDTSSNNNWQWRAGCPSTYLNWASDRPSKTNSNQVRVVISNAGTWFNTYGTGFVTQCACQYALPTSAPIAVPTLQPTRKPSTIPTLNPTHAPTMVPSTSPTLSPTAHPSTLPTSTPIAIPTFIPTTAPSTKPTLQPTRLPTLCPTTSLTRPPTAPPSALPTATPTGKFTFTPQPP